MQRHLWLVLLGFFVAAAPAWSQDREPRRPPPAGEVQIPSQSTLEQEAVTTPGNDFSTNGRTAEQNSTTVAFRLCYGTSRHSCNSKEHKDRFHARLPICLRSSNKPNPPLFHIGTSWNFRFVLQCTRVILTEV